MSKPVFYTFGGSVWIAAPELAILELGYAPDAIDKKIVNLVEGENLHPSFLKINPSATLPTLTAEGKTYSSTIDVVSYLIANAPTAPGKASGTDLIEKVHGDDLDPNFALLLARNKDELKAKAAGLPYVFVRGRQDALERLASTATAQHAPFYSSKIAVNDGLKALYEEQAPADVQAGFFAQSTRHWAALRNFILTDLPARLPAAGFVGGTRPGADDFHVGAWLARIVATVGGTDVSALEGELGEPVPGKVVAYWAAWSARDSWKTVYADGLD